MKQQHLIYHRTRYKEEIADSLLVEETVLLVTEDPVPVDILRFSISFEQRSSVDQPTSLAVVEDPTDPDETQVPATVFVLS